VEEAIHKVQDDVMRELHLHEVINLEEKERQRRIRAEKTHSEDAVHHSDAKEKVQQELLSKFDALKVAQLEEEERARRVDEEAHRQKRAADNAAFDSKANLIVTKRLEEDERQRRIAENLVPHSHHRINTTHTRHDTTHTTRTTHTHERLLTWWHRYRGTGGRVRPGAAERAGQEEGVDAGGGGEEAAGEGGPALGGRRARPDPEGRRAARQRQGGPPGQGQDPVRQLSQPHSQPHTHTCNYCCFLNFESKIPQSHPVATSHLHHCHWWNFN